MPISESQIPNPESRSPATLPPGPKLSLIDTLLYRPGLGNPLDFFRNIARTYGDLASYRMAGELLFLVSDPAMVKDILVTNHRNFTKSRGLERTKRLLGNGLLTSEGAFHLRQRRLMQPAFHRERIAGYGRTMVDVRRSDADAAGPTAATLDVAQRDDAAHAVDRRQDAVRRRRGGAGGDVGDALTGVIESFWMMMLPFSDVLEKLPVPELRRARVARAQLDAIIYRLIAERRASGRDRGDLLSMLLPRRTMRGGRRQRHDRPAGARRGDDDLPRRPRDDRQRADVDLVSR